MIYEARGVYTGGEAAIMKGWVLVKDVASGSLIEVGDFSRTLSPDQADALANYLKASARRHRIRGSAK